MIDIQIQLFGEFRRLQTTKCLHMQVPPGISVQELRGYLKNFLAEGDSNNRLPPTLIDDSALANDESILAEDYILRQSQKLAILPPVCGG